MCPDSGEHDLTTIRHTCIHTHMISRVDTANRMSKDVTFTDARVTKHDYEFQDMSEHCLNGDRMHEYLQEMRKVALDEFDRDAILVGELPGTDPETLKQYVLEDRRELSMTFDFDMMVGRSDGKTMSSSILTFTRNSAETTTRMKSTSTWSRTLVKATYSQR